MIHKEGYPTLGITLFVLVLIGLLFSNFAPGVLPYYLVIAVLFFGFILSFFRNPTRVIPKIDDHLVYAPCDGKVVVIEEVDEPEYLKTRVKQVSIFMSPLNVHVNRNPVNGTVEYAKYHAGSFLPAWEPKASTENERTTVVYKTTNNKLLLIRQVAGALARRIIFYVKSGDKAIQGEDMGFIKFGSRVDLYFPLDAEINVKINDVVKGNLSVIGRI